jgi:hypothetical protein
MQKYAALKLFFWTYCTFVAIYSYSRHKESNSSELQQLRFVDICALWLLSFGLQSIIDVQSCRGGGFDNRQAFSS